MKHVIKTLFIVLQAQALLNCAYDEADISEMELENSIDAREQENRTTPDDDNGDFDLGDPRNPIPEIPDPDPNSDVVSKCGVFENMVLDFESPIDASSYNAFNGELENGRYSMTYPATEVGDDASTISRGIETNTNFELGTGRISLEISDVQPGSNVTMFLKVLAADSLTQIGVSETQSFLQFSKSDNQIQFRSTSNGVGPFIALDILPDELVFESSSDGVTWTEVLSLPVELKGEVRVELQSFQDAPSDRVETVYFDNLNVDCN